MTSLYTPRVNSGLSTTKSVNKRAKNEVFSTFRSNDGEKEMSRNSAKKASERYNPVHCEASESVFSSEGQVHFKIVGSKNDEFSARGEEVLDEGNFMPSNGTSPLKKGTQAYNGPLTAQNLSPPKYAPPILGIFGKVSSKF